MIKINAFLLTAILAAGCAAQAPEERREASTGRITKIVPVIIESDTAPGPGSALAPKTANRKGQRISVLTNDNMLIEVTQDEMPGLRVGDPVRIEGYGTKAKILPP
jgi:hypothetical protein